MYEFFLAVVQVVIVMVLPLVLNRTMRLLLQRSTHAEFFQVPILITLARLQGILAGFTLVLLDFDRQYFDVEQMFMPDGPWNLTLAQFLLERANVFSYDPRPMLFLLTEIHSDNWLMGVFAAVVLPFILLILSFVFWGRNRAFHVLLTIVGIALWTGWLTVYLVSALFWALHLLSFWSLVLLALYIQYRGSKAKTVGWWF